MMPLDTVLTKLLNESQLLARTIKPSEQLQTLAAVVSNQTHLPLQTIEALLHMFSPRGDPTGLIANAALIERILSVFAQRYPEISRALNIDETNIHRLVEALSRFKDSLGASNRLDAFSEPILFAHQKIFNAPSWELFVEQWHLAAIARYEQLAPAQLSNRVWAERFTEFFRVPARIIHALRPEECSEIIELPDELIDLGIETIQRLAGYSRWSPSTRETYVNRWQAFINLAPAQRKFDVHPPPQPGTIATNNHVDLFSTWAEVDNIAGMEWQPEVMRFSQAAQAQQDFDYEELAQFQQPELARAKPIHRADRRSAELVAHPSSRSPGVHSPRLIAHYLRALELLFPEGGLAYWRARAMLDLALHTGLSSRQISEMEIVRSVSDREPTERPAYSAKPGLLIWSPRHFVGRPDALQPATTFGSATYQANLSGLRQTYAPVSDIITITLPGWLVGEINHYLGLAQRAGTHPDSGQLLFSLPRGPEATRHDLASLCKNLHPYVEAQIPSIPPLTPGLTALTFDGLFATQSFDPIYRYYLNLRQRHYLLLPVWYCRVWLTELARAYHAASEAIQRAVAAEYQLLMGRTWPVPASFEVPRLFDGYVGNLRCPTANFIARLNRFIRSDGWLPWDIPDLTEERRRLNHYTARTAIILLELTGLRPFELTRLRISMLDTNAATLAVEGKAHRTGGMGRLIPLAPEVLTRLIHLRESSPRPTRSATMLFRLYDADQILRAVTVDDIQQVLDEAARIFSDGCPAPDAYSFRRLARSEALEAGLPFDIANYLFGHQSAGCELFNPQLEYDWPQVVRESCRLQHHIASKYELALEPIPT